VGRPQQTPTEKGRGRKGKEMGEGSEKGYGNFRRKQKIL
jgi:hypothetical protein